MKKAILVSTSLVALIVAGCASDPSQVAETQPCKVAPITTASAVDYGKPKPVDKLDQDYALMQLHSSGYYRQQLQRRGYGNNTLADASRDCY